MTLNEHIENIKKEFDAEFFMKGDRLVSRVGLSYDSVKPQAMPGELKRFIGKSLRAIAAEREKEIVALIKEICEKHMMQAGPLEEDSSYILQEKILSSLE